MEEVAVVRKKCKCPSDTCSCLDCRQKIATIPNDVNQLETKNEITISSKNNVLTDYGLRFSRGSDGLPCPEDFVPAGTNQNHWENMVNAGITAQKAVNEAIPIGGTIASLYANHRLSYDLDHLLMNLKGEFTEILELLSDVPGWKLAKKTTDKVILGSIDGVDVGFRQIKRRKPLATTVVKTSRGDWRIPTFGEMVNLKAAMVAVRTATRDFLDLVALFDAAENDGKVVDNIMRIDTDFEGLQSHSLLLSLSQHLADPCPDDLGSVDLSNYRGLSRKYQNWNETRERCKKISEMIIARLVLRGKST
jgi:hypothetical protein